MSQAAILLAIRTDGWLLARRVEGLLQARELTLEQPADYSKSAQDIAAALTELGWENGNVCLALPSEMVFTAAIDCDNLPRRNRRTAMLYRLEEQLPIEAENLTADFFPPQGGRAMGLAVRTDSVMQIINPLEQAGVEIASLCPLAVLTLWGIRREHDCSDYVVIAADGSVDIFCMTPEKPARWYSISAEAEQLRRCLQADMLSQPPSVAPLTATVAGDLDDSAISVIGDCCLEVNKLESPAPIEAAAAAASAAVGGKASGWVELRRDALTARNTWSRLGGPVRSAAILAIVLLVSLSVSFYWRAQRYESLAGRYESMQRDQFASVLPGHRIPVNVKSRLRSEHARLAGVSGSGGQVPARPSALESLGTIVTNLPRELRLRILQMRIGPASLLIEGQVRRHGDAEQVARSLNAAGLVISPPRTERLRAGGVGFTLVGQREAGGS